MKRQIVTTFAFKRGEQVPLDQIYTIQGLAGGDWWEKVDDTTSRSLLDLELSEVCIITRDIEITIIVK